MGKAPNLVKYKVITAPFNLTDEELAAVLQEQAAAALISERFELHSIHLIEGRGIVLVLWRNFKT